MSTEPYWTHGTLRVEVFPPSTPTGSPVRLNVTLIGDGGIPIDPATLTLTINDPAGAPTVVTIDLLTRDDTGVYHYAFTPATAGHYTGKAVCTLPRADTEIDFIAEPAASSWQPSASDVAGLLMQRTIDATGVPTGTFSSTTLPTDTQVNLIIGNIVGEIQAACKNIPVALQTDAKLTAIFGAAWIIETSFDEGTSALPGLLAVRYQQALTQLRQACDVSESTFWGVR